MTFKERFTFVDIQRIPNAIELVAMMYGRDLPFEMAEIVGNAMVSRDTYLPQGFAFVWFEPSGQCSVHAHFGKWFRQYPKDILAAMAPTLRRVRDCGVAELVAIADESVEGSADLVRWVGGVKTGERSEVEPIGDIYTIDTHNPTVSAWLNRRG